MNRSENQAAVNTPNTGVVDRVSLSVIIPALDEEAGLEYAVCRTIAACNRLTKDFEILIINDGSTDGTGEIAEKLAAKDSRVRVLHNERNLNCGVSLRRGIRAARCDWILHNGADLPLAPEDIELFLPKLSEADVLVVRRKSLRAHSRWRRLTSITHNLLLRLLFAPRANDLNFVQFYRRTYAQSVPVISTAPASVTPELIMRAEYTGRRVIEVAAEFRGRKTGRPKFGRPHDIMWTIRDMLVLRVRTWFNGWGS